MEEVFGFVLLFSCFGSIFFFLEFFGSVDYVLGRFLFLICTRIGNRIDKCLVDEWKRKEEKKKEGEGKEIEGKFYGCILLFYGN